jgi:hypothetical protein
MYCTQCGAEANETEVLIQSSFDMETGKQNTWKRIACSRDPCHMNQHVWQTAGIWCGRYLVCERCGRRGEWED